jgi:hypothetical protein
MVRKLLEHWLAAIFVVLLFTLGLTADWVFHKRSRAEELLRSSGELKLGRSTLTEAQRLAQEYGGKPDSEGSPASCSAQACTLKFVIDNKPLNYIPGVPAVRFVVSLRVKDGHVNERQIDYSVVSRTGAPFTYQVIDQFDPHSFEAQRLKLDAQGTPHVLKVALGESTTADDRKRAYLIDVSCLARLRGCNAAAAIFPVGL